ncbi:hypothetical protein [Sorangium sp. So ce1151]|uniref:hypothetical protein n=1 Tax=Sorangium sp. So ce1151 TaxID=3133332 RepID=UPI003F5D9289
MRFAAVTMPFEASVGSDYELVEVRSDQVDREMLLAGESSGIPEALQGLFLMDGNPPDQVHHAAGER